jgi:formylglycine-generating enzyme required for sulfatase activity/CheY-like chemotaxis protein
MRILLADDDTGVIQSLLAILKSVPGYEVRVATSGEKAIENAATLGGVDLLITDVVMEPMDGFTLRDEIVTRFPNARTILISGYDLSDYPEQTQHHQVLAKPIDGPTLLAAVARELAAPEPKSAPALATAPRAVAVPQAQPRVAAPTAAAPQATARRAVAAVPSPQPTARAAAPKVTAPAAVAAPRAIPAAQPTARPAAAPQAPRAVAAPQATAAPQQPKVAARAIAVGTPAPAAAPVALKATQRVTPPEDPAPAPAEDAPEPVPEAVVESPQPEPAPAIPAEPETPAAEPQPQSGAASGTALIGHTLGAYQILSQLGEGRWGTVYAAVQTAINRPVGLKVLDQQQARDEGARARFIADARAKAHVQHPAILAVYEAGEAGGHIFYAHEYVDGRNMAELKSAGERLDETTALKVMRTAADGLAYLSVHKIPHSPPEATSIYLSTDGGTRLANLATELGDQQLPIDQEIQALGRIMLGVLPAIQTLKPGMQDLLKRMVQRGPQSITAWGPLLQGIKALEPRVVPLEAAKISAQDRAAIAAVAQTRKAQKKSLYINLATLSTLTIVVALLCWKFLLSNERALNEQVHIPAGDFLFGSGEPVTLPEFWIDKYEVTYGQYAKFVEYLQNHPTTEYDHPRQPRIKSQDMHKPPNWNIYYSNAVQGHPVHKTPIDLNCPVMEVDWWDAYAYAKWKGRELPTEQEWEKAARGEKGLIYPWGDDPDPKKANTNVDFKEAQPDAKGEIDGYNYWNPVDKIKTDKGPYGVIGMAGNVSEWTGSWDAANKHPIIKGGSFRSSDARLDTRRDNLEPGAISESLGFRTVSHTAPGKK